MSEWIKCSERMPNPGERCLFYRPLAGNSQDEVMAVKVAKYDMGQCWQSTVPDGSRPCNPSEGYCHVTHWMPLPPPPAQEKSK